MANQSLLTESELAGLRAAVAGRSAPAERAMKLIWLTHRKAKELGVSVDAYVEGLASGKYPAATDEEIDAESMNET